MPLDVWMPANGYAIVSYAYTARCVNRDSFIDLAKIDVELMPSLHPGYAQTWRVKSLAFCDDAQPNGPLHNGQRPFDNGPRRQWRINTITALLIHVEAAHHRRQDRWEIELSRLGRAHHQVAILAALRSQGWHEIAGAHAREEHVHMGKGFDPIHHWVGERQ